MDVAGATLVVAAAAVAAAVFLRPSPEARQELRLDIVTPATRDPLSLAISPDGRRVAYVAAGEGDPRLWLRPLNALTAQPVAGTVGASFPFGSPDSQSIGFFSGGKLKRVDLGGGLPQTLADAPNGRGGTWTAGVILFAATSGGGLGRVPASGGDVAPVTSLDGTQTVSHRFPQFLPDGRRFLFFAQSSSPAAQGIYVGSLDARGITRLVAADTAGAYLASGSLLYIQQGTLFAKAFNASSGETTGDPVVMADAVAFDGGINIGAFSTSRTGLVAYRTGGVTRRQLTWFDRSGKTIGTLGDADESSVAHPQLSSDGRRVAVDRTLQANIDVWLLDGARATRFTFDPTDDHGPLWSPDGSQIAFDSARKGDHQLYLKPSSGATTEELLFESPGSKGLSDWSPDGKFILYSSQDPKAQSGFDLYVLSLADRMPRPFLKTAFDERMGQFSPDGRWIAYQSNESGRYEIYVRPFPGPGGQWQVSTNGGIMPRWRRDGKELYYISRDDSLMATPINLSGATPQPGTPVALFRTRIVGGGVSTDFRHEYDVSADGRFLINVAADAVAAPITLVLNWRAAAR